MQILVREKSKGREDSALTGLRSQCYRLRLQEPDSDLEALEARSCLPPELPAGKRGGWHHDSVYPSFASPPCPTGVELRRKVYRIDLPGCPSDMSPCAARPTRRRRSSTRRARWAGCWRGPGRS